VGGGLGGDAPGRSPGHNPLGPPPARTPVVRNTVEENILVTLMPEKEGMFMFQHHNYEVSSQRRSSKVIRRYSDFVWLLDCLHKRYPFRVLPLLPPKRVAVNGNHLSNDNSFIEKRRRGLARFLNAVVRHPVLSQEQLVVMFLTVPTVSPLSSRPYDILAKPLTQSTRNWLCGGSRRASLCRTSLPIVYCPRG
jgi:sorting nexin-8